jgi:PAS domain S-box-containing protein
MLIIDAQGIIIDFNSEASSLFYDNEVVHPQNHLSNLGIPLELLQREAMALPDSNLPKIIATDIDLIQGARHFDMICNRIRIDDKVYYSIALKSSNEVIPSQHHRNNDDIIDGFLLNASLPILIVDTENFEITSVNEQAVKFFGLPKSQLLGFPLAGFTNTPAEQFNPSLSSFIKNKYTGLEQHFTTEALELDAEIHYSVIDYRCQKVLFCILIDITQQNLAFSELQRIKNSLASEVASQTKDLVRINNVLLEQIKKKQIIEQELRQSQELFMHLFRLNPNGLVLRELQSKKIIELNQSFLKIFGLKANETKGKTLEDFNLLINSEAYNQLLADLHEKRRLTGVPLTMMSNSGHVVFVQWSGEAIKINDQEFILEVFHDTTQTQIYQQKLEESEERYRTMFNNALVGISRTRTTTGIICNCNTYFAQLIGYRNEKHIAGKSIEKHFKNATQRSKFLKTLREKGSAIGEFEITTLQGKGIWVVDYAVINIKERYIDEVVVDITDRKIMENLLVSNENRFRSMIEKASDLIVIVDSKGMILYLSPSIETELGYGIDNYFNENILDYLDPDQAELVTEVLNRKGAKHYKAFDVSVKHKDGYDKVYEVSVTDLRNDPAVGGIILNAHNITEKIKARDEIKAALEKETELSRQKTQFISTVSHEFRTPLTNISLNVQLLQKYLKDNRLEKAHYAINRLLNAERRLTSLLNEVSLVSKDQSGRLSFTPELWDLRMLTDDLLEQIDYQLQSNVNVVILDCSETKAQLDKNLLTHILGNLVSNAIKYSPSATPIDVRIGLNGSGIFEIGVKDQGIGIPKEEQQFLFDPYFRASNSKDVSGTGLGLNIVKRCVELHGGEITLNSEEDKGTEIVVAIPI